MIPNKFLSPMIFDCKNVELQNLLTPNKEWPHNVLPTKFGNPSNLLAQKYLDPQKHPFLKVCFQLIRAAEIIASNQAEQLKGLPPMNQ